MGRIDGIVARARGDDDEEIHPHRKKKKRSIRFIFFPLGLFFGCGVVGSQLSHPLFFLSACGGSTLE